MPPTSLPIACTARLENLFGAPQSETRQAAIGIDAVRMVQRH